MLSSNIYHFTRYVLATHNELNNLLNIAIHQKIQTGKLKFFTGSTSNINDIVDLVFSSVPEISFEVKVCKYENTFITS